MPCAARVGSHTDFPARDSLYVQLIHVAGAATVTVAPGLKEEVPHRPWRVTDGSTPNQVSVVNFFVNCVKKRFSSAAMFCTIVNVSLLLARALSEAKNASPKITWR